MYSDCVTKIIHVDMDAFFAAVEQRNNPALRGKPVIVGGPPDSRGVVSTCSYEARRFGIHSAMPSARAYRLCPQGIFITNPDFTEYKRVSRQIRAVFAEYTDLVEPLSLDEAYLDVTEPKRGPDSATGIAREIRARVRRETGLTCSAGVSYNKFLAKVASDYRKPDGLTVIRPEEARKFLDDLPIGKFYGVGEVTERRMKSLGILTGRDLRQWPLYRLAELFGKAGMYYYKVCRGIDERRVETDHVRKSVGKERTFARDIVDIEELDRILDETAERVAEALESAGVTGSTVTVKVKYHDFRLCSRSRRAGQPLLDASAIAAIARELLRRTEAGRVPVRLLGISLSQLSGDGFESPGDQIDLPFAPSDR